MRGRDVVVILGAGPGLGAAIAAAFAETGASVVLVARNADRLARLAEESGAAGFLSADVSDEPALRAAFATIRDRYGAPDVLVHNPSIACEAPVTRTPLPELINGFGLAAGSLLVAIQEVAPAMRERRRGTILVTGSGAGVHGSTWSAGLAAQKAAVRNLALSAAAELEPDQVAVATITIDGILGTEGFEPDTIAREYVRLHHLADRARRAGKARSAPPGHTRDEADRWNTEVLWPRS